MKKSVLLTVLDGLPELIYVCDLETYRLLYLNEAGRNIFGDVELDSEHRCHEVIHGFDAPCPFCTNDKLGEDAFCDWEYTHPVHNKHYLLRDRLLEWRGRPARLEIAFDVTDHRRESESFKFLADAGAVTVDCVRVLENNPNFDEALDEALAVLGRFLNADRAYLFKLHNGRMTNTHEWCNDGVAPQRHSLLNVPVGVVERWLGPLSEGKTIFIDKVDELFNEDDPGEYELLKRQDIVALVVVPLIIDDQLVGFLGVDNPRRSEQLEIVEAPLEAFAGFVAARMKRERTQRRVAELTWNDALTCARSRAAFYRDFDRGIFRQIGLVLVDADRLTIVNREQGRVVGDKMLCNIASCLTEIFGHAVYRIGDDEFCAVVLNVDYSQFADLAERAARRFLDGGIPASLGTAWHEACTSTTGLLDLAGDRMRMAKRGRHRAVDLGVDLLSDAAVSNLLRPGGAQDAVKANLLSIYLMPQYSGDTGEIVSAEALIRYHGGDRNLQALPSSFIPALEDMGEISAIDFFALSQACETIARWQSEGRKVVPIAVNFSRRTIGDEGFVERVAETVASYEVDRSLIEIEITESAREENEELLRAVTNQLRELSFRVAIDDFGVDNANFTLFIQLEFDVLKIDKSLVWGLGVEDRTMQVIRSLVNLSEDLGIETVAEGIESEEQYQALREAGCTRAQGYRIGKAQPIEDFERQYLS